ncbi:hypothetical protein Y032_0002g677 [Ancylostoma ceylanicum]|uniref:Uncharacterized protein n=1 Tax=Ancylostoma ceylanicum TaxID=53326 RepID=A0A016W0P9_9BILA|nr:hypothetical protein Y032_0002g677 [Ancylostoma ceylanicum]
MSKKRRHESSGDDIDGEPIPSDPEEFRSDSSVKRHKSKRDERSRNGSDKKTNKNSDKKSAEKKRKGDSSSRSGSSSSSSSDSNSSDSEGTHLVRFYISHVLASLPRIFGSLICGSHFFFSGTEL